MLSLPDRDFSIEDLERLADWIDACVLLEDTAEVSKGEVFDVLLDSGLMEEDTKKARRRKSAQLPDLSHQDRVRCLVDDVWGYLRKRKRRLQEGYPFDVNKELIVRNVASWKEASCFTMLLLADIGHSYRGVQVEHDPSSDFCMIFEKVVQACTGLIFKGTAVRFGWPRDPDWPVSIEERIARLADEFDLRPEDLADKVHGRDSDLGLDVAIRMGFGDEDPGTCIVMTQCATGRNWGQKKEPSLEEWHTLIGWKAHLIRAIAYPRRISADPMIGRTALRLQAILLDRMRLLSAGNPDSRLQSWARESIAQWCEARINELPLI